jgi:hypothetical protein
MKESKKIEEEEKEMKVFGAEEKKKKKREILNQRKRRKRRRRKREDIIMIIVKQKNIWENIRELTKLLNVYVVSLFLISSKQLTTSTEFCLLACARKGLLQF